MSTIISIQDSDFRVSVMERFEERELLMYRLQGSDIVRFGVLEMDYSVCKNDPDSGDQILHLWRQTMVDNKVNQTKEGTYYKNIVKRLGVIRFRKFFNENPEYFV